jgi:curved DNA-binding protein CbpA
MSGLPADPHRVLGVPRGASPRTLHEAYRRLVKLHHPDRNGGSEASARRFQEIRAAYEELRSRPQTLHAPPIDDRLATLERELSEARAAQATAPEPHPSVRQVSDLIDGLDDLASRLDGR